MCNDCGWREYLEKASSLVERRGAFKMQFAQSVAEWIDENQHVTEKQKEAIDKIEEE